jgi:hypothetical protein
MSMVYEWSHQKEGQGLELGPRDREGLPHYLDRDLKTAPLDNSQPYWGTRTGWLHSWLHHCWCSLRMGTQSRQKMCSKESCWGLSHCKRSWLRCSSGSQSQLGILCNQQEISVSSSFSVNHTLRSSWLTESHIGSIELSYSYVLVLYITENRYNKLRLLLSHSIMAATVSNNKRKWFLSTSLSLPLPLAWVQIFVHSTVT